jgi:hypothetical protein
VCLCVFHVAPSLVSQAANRGHFPRGDDNPAQPAAIIFTDGLEISRNVRCPQRAECWPRWRALCRTTALRTDQRSLLARHRWHPAPARQILVQRPAAGTIARRHDPIRRAELQRSKRPHRLLPQHRHSASHQYIQQFQVAPSPGGIGTQVSHLPPLCVMCPRPSVPQHRGCEVAGLS